MAVATPPAPSAAPAASKTGTNDPVERGRYRVGRRERVLCAQRVEGRVCLTDAPAAPKCGRFYLIEDNLTSLTELDAIVADYLGQAKQRGGIPARVLW